MSLLTISQQKSQGTLNKDLLFCTLSTDHIKFQGESIYDFIFTIPLEKLDRFLKQRELLKSFLTLFSQIHAFRELLLPFF